MLHNTQSRAAHALILARQRPQRAMECWDHNLQLLEGLLRPFEIQPEEQTPQQSEQVEPPIPSPSRPPLDSRVNWIWYPSGKSNAKADASGGVDATDTQLYVHWSQASAKRQIMIR